MQNNFAIDGTICTEPKFAQTLSGIPQCQWIMQHQSECYEQGIRRKVWLRLAVVVCGKELCDQVHNDNYQIGTTIRCVGFLGATKSRKNDTQIILHSQTIERIEIVADEEQA